METLPYISFDPISIPKILSGHKTATLRLWSKQRVFAGDRVVLIDSYQRKPFAVALVTSVNSKSFKQLTEQDKNATQFPESFKQFQTAFERYYNTTISADTPFLMINYQLLDAGQGEHAFDDIPFETPKEDRPKPNTT